MLIPRRNQRRTGDQLMSAPATLERKPPTPEPLDSAALPQTALHPAIPRKRPQPDIAVTKDAYTTRCGGCPSMLMLPQPWNHCPKCHHRWPSRGLSAPVRCIACRFNLFNWRSKNRINDRSNSGALIP
jgi:hypothetical protein